MTNTTTSTSIWAYKSEWLSALIDAGFALIPLLPGTKAPVTHGWANTPADPTRSPSDYPDNYGVVLKDDMFVLDVDPRAFPSGENPFNRVKELCGIPEGGEFNTYTVRSRQHPVQNGLHIYFRKPEGFAIRTHSAVFGKGIEAKSHGAQLVGPGSLHPETGKHYVVVAGDPADLMDVPDVLLQEFARAHSQSGVGLEDFVDDEVTRARYRKWLASREPAVQGSEGDPWTFQTAAYGRDMGLSELATYELMRDCWNPRCSPPWTEKGLAVKVANAYKYAKDDIGNAHPSAVFERISPEDKVAGVPEEAAARNSMRADRAESERIAGLRWDIDYTKTREIKCYQNTLNNVRTYFTTPSHGAFINQVYGLLRYNEFSHKIEFTRSAPWHHANDDRRVWTNDDNAQFRTVVSVMMGWNVSEKTVNDGIVAIARENSYHPIREYFNTLEWDGAPRLHKLFNYYVGGEDNVYTQQAGILWMKALVARIYSPGIKFDHVPVLEGPQGIMKSTFCEVIMGPEYHADIFLDPQNKDTILNMMGKCVIEISEMAHTRKKEVEEIKSFITKRVDTFRKPYGTVAEDIPRQSVFIGTLNPGPNGTYLPDATGNRRFWPILCTLIKTKELRADREQLLAEAVHMWRSGNHTLYMEDKKALHLAALAQESRTDKEVWVDVIRNWLESEHRRGIAHKTLTSVDVAETVLNIPPRNCDKRVFARIANAMAVMGWPNARTRDNGVMRRGYMNPTYDADLDDLLKGV